MLSRFDHLQTCLKRASLLQLVRVCEGARGHAALDRGVRPKALSRLGWLVVLLTPKPLLAVACSWFGDGLSWQWSYYAALMSSATRLAAPLGGTRDFGGYVVPRSSGGTVDGALLRRVISLIGGGAKALTYFTFGPECERSNAS